MKLELERLQFDTDCTIGSLRCDGEWLCWTLEDAVRPDGVKIPGETAIPRGAYTVELTMSPRFKVIMPLLVNVRGFVGVRIHWGNSADDTEGCVLVGQDRYPKTIGHSRAAWNTLMARLTDAQSRGEPVTLEIA